MMVVSEKQSMGSKKSQPECMSEKMTEERGFYLALDERGSTLH